MPDAQLRYGKMSWVSTDQPFVGAEGSNEAPGHARAGAMFDQIAVQLTAALGDELLGLYAHGSWVSGDFAPLRSDLDLLAVLSRQPDEPLLSLLEHTHDRLAAHHPQWAGRIEVEYVALSTIKAVAADPGNPGDHVIARISPGEHLHLLPATSHRLLTWAGVREGGHPLHGPASKTLLPPVNADVVRAAVLNHVRDWPEWVRDMRHPGGQAYAVLTVCRALHLIQEGKQVSKRQAANYAIDEAPEWAELIRWARDWWYAEGTDDQGTDDQDTDDEDSPHHETIRFVDDITSTILGDRPTSPP